jgi:hypothetical protein
MIPFKRFELSDLPMLRSCYAADHDPTCRICDATPGTATMWRHTFDVRFYCEANTVLYAVRTPDGREAFSFPIGAQPELMLQRTRAHCAACGQAPVFYLVSASKLDMLRHFFGDLEICTDRNDADYLYQRDALVSLAGRKYSAQRNHIHKFEHTAPDWYFETIGSENMDKARQFFAFYKQTVHKDSVLFDEEERIIDEIFDNYALYGMFGGILCTHGRAIGLSIGEIYKDTLYVHVEKGDISYPGVYQMLSHQFCVTFASPDVVYVNREDDMGDPGLRKSKLSYHPYALLDKYTVTAHI